MRRRDRLAIVTGGTSGIGQATAIAFANHGARVAVVGRDEPRGEAVVAESRDAGGEAIFLRGDVRLPADCQRVVAQTIAAFGGRLDSLVNNAGVYFPDNAIDCTEEEWDLTVDISLKGSWLMSKYALPTMIAQQSGVIIHQSSGWGIQGGDQAVAYCAAKGALVVMTKAMAIDHGPQGIRVNSICPGDVNTPMLAGEAKARNLYACNPADRIGDYLRCFAKRTAVTLEDRMTRHPRMAPAGLIAALMMLPSIGQAQSFKVDKYSIGGDGGTDYVTAEPGTGRVFVSRGTHVMVVDGATGKVLGDIPNTPRIHGVALAPKFNHGFTTNGGDSSVTMFDLTSLVFIKKIPIRTGGLDGIMYDDFNDRIVLTNHSRPIGTAISIDANTGDVMGTAELEDDAPEGAASDGMGKLYVNNEGKNTIQVLDAATMKVLASWPIGPCDGPTGIAYDRATNRIFSGCGKTSVVVDASAGKVVATIANGDGVDALGWDPGQKLIYIPAGRAGNVTVVHQDAPDKYTVVATVPTMAGAKTITVDPVRHVAYLFQPEYGPAPAPAPGAPPPPAGSRPPRGPVIGAWFFAITH